jgi:hypothetical protein
MGIVQLPGLRQNCHSCPTACLAAGPCPTHTYLHTSLAARSGCTRRGKDIER